MPEQFHSLQQPEFTAAEEQAERIAVGSELQGACGDLAAECSDTLNETPEGRLQLVCAEAGLSLDEGDPAKLLENRHLNVAFRRPLPMPPAIKGRCLVILQAELEGVEPPVSVIQAPEIKEIESEAEEQTAVLNTIETREGEIDGAIESSQEESIELDRSHAETEEELAETEDDLAVANAVIEDFFQTKVQAGTLGQIREQINVELGKTLTGEDLTQKIAEAEAKYIAPHEARLTAMQAVFTPEEIQKVFGGSLTNTVSLNLKGETNAQIYAAVFARIDAGFANDDDRRREVRAQVEAQLGISTHAVETPKNASEMQDSLKKGYGTETKTETQTVEEPPGSGNYVEKEVVVSETTIPFSEAFPFVVSHEPYVVMYPKTPGTADYQVQGRVAGLAPVQTTVKIPPTGALPEADIHTAINKAFIAGNFRNAGLNGALEHLCGRSDATLGTSADVSAGAIGQTDMLQNVMQMFGGELADIRTGFLSAGALQGMTPDLRWLTIDGDFGAMNQNDPAKVQNMMTALFGSSHGEIANNMSKARGVINSGGAETPSFQALYKAMHPEDVANGFANLKAVMGAQGLAKMNLG